MMFKVSHIVDYFGYYLLSKDFSTLSEELTLEKTVKLRQSKQLAEKIYTLQWISFYLYFRISVVLEMMNEILSES